MSRPITDEIDPRVPAPAADTGAGQAGRRLLLVRADAAPGRDEAILATCEAHGVPPLAVNRAGQPQGWFVMAVEVSAQGSLALATELRALPGVIEVSVTNVSATGRAPVAGLHH